MKLYARIIIIRAYIYAHTYVYVANGQLSNYKHMQKYIRTCMANMCTISICDQVCKNRSYLHIQFCDFEDTELSLWVSYRYVYKFDTRKIRTINNAILDC